MGTKITDHYFEYESDKFSRDNAHEMEFGTFGQKKDPIGPKSQVDPENKVSVEHLEKRVKYNTTVDVDWSQASKADVEAQGAIKYFGIGGAAAVSGSYEKAKSAKLKLLNFSIDEGPLKTMLNQDANAARKYLADEGDDGRIVSGLWILAEGELSESFSTAGSISVSGNVPGDVSRARDETRTRSAVCRDARAWRLDGPGAVRQ